MTQTPSTRVSQSKANFRSRFVLLNSYSHRYERPHRTQFAPFHGKSKRLLWSNAFADVAQPSIGLSIRPAETMEYWSIADCHCKAFYPYIPMESIWSSLLRLDRVVSLIVGREREDLKQQGQFLCLVAADAEADFRDCQKPRNGSILRSIIDMIVKLSLPIQALENYGSTAGEHGIVGAVVIDTMGDHVPPRRKPSPLSSTMSSMLSPLLSFDTEEVRRHHLAYISNLAVHPSARRKRIGLQLVREAEEVAATWGCRSVALHVDPGNEAAVNLYRSLGYRFVSRETELAAWFEGRNPLALMVKLLRRGSSQR